VVANLDCAHRYPNVVIGAYPCSLYPALHRLEKRGWIAAEWRLSENDRRAKYYALTAVGGVSFTRRRLSGPPSPAR
jgi:DNA-binding PadR family transcriptional regulator